MLVLPLAGGLTTWTAGVHHTVLMLNSCILCQNACLLLHVTVFILSNSLGHVFPSCTKHKLEQKFHRSASCK